MAWTHFLVAIAGAFTPVLHLLCDDWISTLGLEALRSFNFSLKLDYFNGIMAFLHTWFKRICKCDPDPTQISSETHETTTSAMNITNNSIHVSNVKQQFNFSKPESFPHKMEDRPSIKENDANNLNEHVTEIKDISTNFAKTTNVAKNNFSPIREIEESIETQNSSSAKNSTYDDLIELKDDLHYL